MDWFTLYADDTQLFSVKSLQQAKYLASPYVKQQRSLEIKRADPEIGRVLELWHYDASASDWVFYKGSSYAP